MTAERCYLDHNASAPLRPGALEAMIAALCGSGNASSVHHEGRQARALIETAREEVAALAAVRPAQIVFTSGGTEANVMALSPAWFARPDRVRLFVSAVEHPSVLNGGQFAPEDVEALPVDDHGVLDVDTTRERIHRWRVMSNGAPFMASVMAANNETGAMQPVEALAVLVHECGGVVHCDAVQTAGKIAFEPVVRSADLITLSAHKFGGPKGTGALIIADEQLGYARPLLRGGGQERGFRAGTENAAAIAGFGVAAGVAAREMPSAGQVAVLRDRLEEELLRIAPDATIFARETQRLPNTSCFAAPGMQAETLLMAFDLEGIALSAGSACSSGKIERSHVLTAMGVEADVARAAIRVSLGWNTTETDIDRFGAAWTRIYNTFQERRRAA